jgi:hypothetical protein
LRGIALTTAGKVLVFVAAPLLSVAVSVSATSGRPYAGRERTRELGRHRAELLDAQRAREADQADEPGDGDERHLIGECPDVRRAVRRAETEEHGAGEPADAAGCDLSRRLGRASGGAPRVAHRCTVPRGAAARTELDEEALISVSPRSGAGRCRE